MIWKILEIEKTKDEEVIRNAYREKLRFVNPEDDQQGFMELRQAYEEALAYAKENVKTVATTTVDGLRVRKEMSTESSAIKRLDLSMLLW